MRFGHCNLIGCQMNLSGCTKANNNMPRDWLCWAVCCWPHSSRLADAFRASLRPSGVDLRGELRKLRIFFFSFSIKLIDHDLGNGAAILNANARRGKKARPAPVPECAHSEMLYVLFANSCTQSMPNAMQINWSYTFALPFAGLRKTLGGQPRSQCDLRSTAEARNGGKKPTTRYPEA